MDKEEPVQEEQEPKEVPKAFDLNAVPKAEEAATFMLPAAIPPPLVPGEDGVKPLAPIEAKTKKKGKKRPVDESDSESSSSYSDSSDASFSLTSSSSSSSSSDEKKKKKRKKKQGKKKQKASKVETEPTMVIDPARNVPVFEAEVEKRRQEVLAALKAEKEESKHRKHEAKRDYRREKLKKRDNKGQDELICRCFCFSIRKGDLDRIGRDNVAYVLWGLSILVTIFAIWWSVIPSANKGGVPDHSAPAPAPPNPSGLYPNSLANPYERAERPTPALGQRQGPGLYLAQAPDLQFLTRDEVYHFYPALSTLHSVRDFVRGYARSVYACDLLLRVLNYHTTIAVNQERDEFGHSRYNKTLYLASSSAYSPYFCVNLPKFALLQTDIDGPTLNGWQISEQLWNNVKDVWFTNMNQGLYATTALSSGQLFAESPLHTAAAMLYLDTHLFARDFEALGKPRASEASLVMNIVSYDALSYKTQHLYGPPPTPQCYCGLHKGLARHIVNYVDAHYPQGRLFVEPIIVQRGETIVMDVHTLPWVSQVNMSEPYFQVDHQLRTEFNMSTLRISIDITIDAIRLTYSGSRDPVKRTSARLVTLLAGNTALCVQYCESMAYALKQRSYQLPLEERRLQG